MLKKLFHDEAGFVVSAELALILTLLICMAAVGWSAVRIALVQELNDLAQAIGAIDQSYNVPGLSKDLEYCGCKTACAGFKYEDEIDAGDTTQVNIVCFGVDGEVGQ